MHQYHQSFWLSSEMKCKSKCYAISKRTLAATTMSECGFSICWVFDLRDMLKALWHANWGVSMAIWVGKAYLTMHWHLLSLVVRSWNQYWEHSVQLCIIWFCDKIISVQSEYLLGLLCSRAPLWDCFRCGCIVFVGWAVVWYVCSDENRLSPETWGWGSEMLYDPFVFLHGPVIVS